MFEYDNETQIDSENDEDFACPFDNCEYKDSSLRILQLHVSVLHETLEREQEVLEHHKNDDINKCDMRDNSFTASKFLKMDKQKVHEDGKDKEYITLNFDNDEKSYKCEICGTSFLSMKSCLDHYNSTHMKNQKEVQKLSGKNNSVSYKCEICEKTFHSKTKLKQHQIWHGERNHECDICHKMFPCEQFVKRHKNLIHFPKAIPCRWNCGRTFIGHGGRMRHEKTYHYLNKPLEKICDICGKPCPTEIGLKIHKNTHLNPSERIDEYKCSICSETFPTAHQHTEHRKSVHNTAKFECPKCNKKFVIEKNMKLHVEMHESFIGKKDQPGNHLCHQCSSGKKYSMTSLRRHLKTNHSAIYKCNQCQKVFTGRNQKHRFNLHMRKHQNSKCHLCNLVLANPINARIHLIGVHKLTIDELIVLGRYDPNAYQIRKKGESWLNRYDFYYFYT